MTLIIVAIQIGDLSKVMELLRDPELRKKMGENALVHSRQYFSKETVTKAWFDYYQGIVG